MLQDLAIPTEAKHLCIRGICWPENHQVLRKIYLSMLGAESHLKDRPTSIQPVRLTAMQKVLRGQVQRYWTSLT